MNILHIGKITDNLCNGINVVVPQHINFQNKYENVAFFNLNNIKINQIEKQLDYIPHFDIKKIEKDFPNISLVVFHDVHHIKYIKIYKNLIKNKIPYVIVPHGCLTKNALRKKWLKKLVAHIFLFNKFIKNAKAIQFLSEIELQGSIFNKKGFIGTNGVLIPENHKENFRSSNIKIIYVGRTEVKIKGIDLMLKALSLKKEFLKTKNVSVELYGPDLNGMHMEIKELIRKFNVNDLVTLNNKIVGQDKKSKLLDADLFIQTSRTEGMPVGILEALSFGLPVIITKGTNLGEIVKEYNAGWVSETTAEDIAEKIELAVNSFNEYSEKSKNAVSLIEDNFSWDNISKNTLENYKRII